MKDLPGERTASENIARMIRVNHAGEYGAARIYEGQLAVLKHSPQAEIIEGMRVQEQTHLDTFDQLLRQRDIKPTLLLPLWHIAGFALGALTARLGEKAAMACTVAVEEVIDQHYAEQCEYLKQMNDEADLAALIHQFREDERHHCDIGIAQGAADAPAFKWMKKGIQAASKCAIWLSTRI